MSDRRTLPPPAERVEEELVFEYNLPARHRSGSIWRRVFQTSTVVGIVALLALLYNIGNQAFGLVAVQNENEPEALVLAVLEERMLGAPNTVSSEDDDELVQGVAGNPNAAGFFGYAYYEQNADALRALRVDGVTPTADTVDSGEYPLARPLYIYTTAGIMQEKPQVADFVDFYLTYVNDEIGEVGYFPTKPEALQAAKRTWLEAVGQEGAGELPDVDPESVSGEIAIAGSSTVYPLSAQIVQRFRDEDYTGQITVDNIGTTAGFQRFCVEGEADIVNASRPIQPAEAQACRDNGRDPIAFRVGTDAIAVVVSQGNDFATSATTDELAVMFTNAQTWSDVKPDWPAAEMEQFIPGAVSGTLDFFAETVFDMTLQDLPKETLVSILEANVSQGLFRRFESEQPFAERSQQNVLQLVQERVVAPEVQDTWPLYDSLFYRPQIEVEVVEDYPEAHLEFRSWLHTGFVTSPQSKDPEDAGVRTAILGSLWTILVTLLTAFPIGVGAAIYLEEYADRENRLNRIIQTNINNLAGVPSIIYGLLGLAIFVRTFGALTSGVAFGAGDPTTANGRTILSAGMTLGLLILPLIIINAQEAIRAVPQSLRRASFGLGATKWQTIWHHVLPNALPGILTGTILAVSRAIGETAPLIVVGASTYITVDPDGPFSKFTTLPIQIYQWTARPQDEFRNIAAAAIIVLLILLLSLNATAVLLRNRFSRRL